LALSPDGTAADRRLLGAVTAALASCEAAAGVAVLASHVIDGAVGGKGGDERYEVKELLF